MELQLWLQPHLWSSCKIPLHLQGSCWCCIVVVVARGSRPYTRVISDDSTEQIASTSRPGTILSHQQPLRPFVVRASKDCQRPHPRPEDGEAAGGIAGSRWIRTRNPDPISIDYAVPVSSRAVVPSDAAAGGCILYTPKCRMRTGAAASTTSAHTSRTRLAFRAGAASK